MPKRHCFGGGESEEEREKWEGEIPNGILSQFPRFFPRGGAGKKLASRACKFSFPPFTFPFPKAKGVGEISLQNFPSPPFQHHQFSPSAAVLNRRVAVLNIGGRIGNSRRSLVPPKNNNNAPLRLPSLGSALSSSTTRPPPRKHQPPSKFVALITLRRRPPPPPPPPPRPAGRIKNFQGLVKTKILLFPFVSLWRSLSSLAVQSPFRGGGGREGRKDSLGHHRRPTDSQNVRLCPAFLSRGGPFFVKRTKSRKNENQQSFLFQLPHTIRQSYIADHTLTLKVFATFVKKRANFALKSLYRLSPPPRFFTSRLSFARQNFFTRGGGGGGGGFYLLLLFFSPRRR